LESAKRFQDNFHEIICIADEACFTMCGQGKDGFHQPLINPIYNQRQLARSVSGRSKPAREGRMKTSHFEERIALRAMQTAQRRDESTQRELATFDNDLGGAWLVQPADCA